MCVPVQLGCGGAPGGVLQTSLIPPMFEPHTVLRPKMSCGVCVRASVRACACAWVSCLLGARAHGRVWQGSE